ncbi:type I restriction enzyme, R subunit [Carnobacterium iners]|uniref:Type I restriction enzyme endonuclease subunit n=1 Tax=Carnobacterium iners TaxID=1073423 RepID=A0A1X7MQP7_9LACT|nr:HsdR family type I site-specific deoxyribonuclease [Carnobacterium iners]SEL05495.1 type I restriction enzyme, R subunit [Carnobacterium iners]SMH26934.1 type I restriction enzyme, R subunit [Carnobacterium iners]
MSNAPKNVSEAGFQDRFVERLHRFKWESPEELDGTKLKVTTKDLINHWRSELNRINVDQLEGIPLTDNEFSQVMAQVDKIANSFEAAKLLAMEGSKGKIDGIYRDADARVTREQITLTIFKKAQVSGGDSSYRIAREVATPNGNRFDIVLLINGLPLINIEQKRADRTLDEAFSQFERYYKEGEYTKNFMAFSQMMVITSEVATRYFATPKTVLDFNPSFLFHWADQDNIPVNNWEEVIGQFLMIPMAHQMVGDYLVIDQAKEEEDRRHMLMRSYQVHALQAVEGAAFGWDNEERIPHGGFVWHTTGSGKTITSFKTALFLSTRAGFDKVVFLLDRRELDSRTSEDFKAYAAYESVSVDGTKHTYGLRKIMHSSNSGIVVTTTFKLNSLVKDLIEADDTHLADKRIVFIIDEAHRTTMGQMMGTIKDYFGANSLFFGYTGTPLFDENQAKGKINQKSEVIDTTEKLFGPLVHRYTIEEAIADKNVLGFHVDYINTGEFSSYEDLREQLIDLLKEEHPETEERTIERQVQELTDLEVEKAAKEESLLVYHDDMHIPRVVEEILAQWDAQSQDRTFNAILTVAYKKRVMAYFDEFKKQMKEKDSQLNIVMTFSFGTTNEAERMDPAIIENMFKEYGLFTGIEFVVGDQKRGEEAYFEDVIERAAKGGSGRNPKNIDLVIVADQLLTGYNSKLLNTLYVDRSLGLHGLIQAYSRTNRIYGSTKEFGTIINFQYPKITEEMVNVALKLYGSGGTSSKAIVEPYLTASEKFKLLLIDMKEVLPDPTNWQAIQPLEETNKLFVQAYKEASEQFNLVEQYYEYQWNDEAFGMDERTWFYYIGAYRNLLVEEGGDLPLPPPVPMLAGKTKLAGTQVIDANHILNLIGSKTISTNGRQIVDTETLRIIYQQIEELSNLGENEQAKLLKEFVVEELEAGKISSEINFDRAFEEWKNDKKKTFIYGVAKEWGVDGEVFEKSVEAYSLTSPKDIPFIDDLIGSLDFSSATKKQGSNQLMHNFALTPYLIKTVPQIKTKFKL